MDLLKEVKIHYHNEKLVININADNKGHFIFNELIHKHIKCNACDNWTKKGNIFIKYEFENESDYLKAVNICKSISIKCCFDQ